MERGLDTFSNVPRDYVIGMMAIERLVSQATADLGPLEGGIGMVVPADDVLIMDRLDQLVCRMARMEQLQMGRR